MTLLQREYCSSQSVQSGHASASTLVPLIDGVGYLDVAIAVVGRAESSMLGAGGVTRQSQGKEGNVKISDVDQSHPTTTGSREDTAGDRFDARGQIPSQYVPLSTFPPIVKRRKMLYRLQLLVHVVERICSPKKHGLSGIT